MGLAEPRKRIKISHDPRNLQWSTSETSFGTRMMQRQGWSAGEALGAQRGRRAEDLDAAKIRVTVKDDSLGLGASLKSKNVENQRTGLDAFQGLLGRLNAKSEQEVHEVEKKIEDRKLAVWAQGRWGGMVFVPGGLLVQKDSCEMKVEQTETGSGEDTTSSDTTEGGKRSRSRTSKSVKKEKRENKREEEVEGEDGVEEIAGSTKEEKRKHKEERRARKEARRLRKTEQEVRRQQKLDRDATNTSGDSSETNASSQPREINITVVTQDKARSGRQLLRGRNIQAKRTTFQDAKLLDEIFMRRG